MSAALRDVSPAPDTDPNIAACPTLVLLPGMDGTSRLFAPLLAALPPDVEAIPVAYPADPALGYETLERRVRAALPTDRPFVLLGESYSGPIAVAIAAAPPPTLCGLILCCSFVRNPRPATRLARGLLRILPALPMPLRLLRSIMLGRFATPALVRRLADALSDVSLGVLRSRALQVIDVDVTDALSRIALPVLYLQASHDRVIPARVAQEIAAVQPEAEIAILQGPHFLLQAAPEASSAALVGFARRALSRFARSPVRSHPHRRIA